MRKCRFVRKCKQNKNTKDSFTFAPKFIWLDLLAEQLSQSTKIREKEGSSFSNTPTELRVYRTQNGNFSSCRIFKWEFCFSQVSPEIVMICLSKAKEPAASTQSSLRAPGPSTSSVKWLQVTKKQQINSICQKVHSFFHFGCWNCSNKASSIIIHP